jgi:hypothetical protein
MDARFAQAARTPWPVGRSGIDKPRKRPARFANIQACRSMAARVIANSTEMTQQSRAAAQRKKFFDSRSLPTLLADPAPT